MDKILNLHCYKVGKTIHLTTSGRFWLTRQMSWYPDGYLIYLIPAKDGRCLGFFHSKILHHQFNLNFVAIDWIEDSLISKAFNSLDNKPPSEALTQFRAAFEQNPEHYYLAKYIHHLEFIKRQSHEMIASTFEPIPGQYGTVKFYIQDGRYYFENVAGHIHELLPLNAYQFMVPNWYPVIIQIEVEDNSVSGLKFVYGDGDEDFFPRTDVLDFSIQSE